MALIKTNLFSNSLAHGTACTVIIPESAASMPRNRLPVLYLLHGSGGDETTWQRFSRVERYAEQYRVAVVMPAAEAMSGYSDLVHGRAFYSYVAEELPGVMSGFYGFSQEKDKNAICGFSMGGSGALKIGLSKPERFFAIGCLSSAIRLTPLPADTHGLAGRDYIAYDGRNLAGSEEDVENSAKRAVELGVAPKIYHRIGRDDFMLPLARETADFFRSFAGDPFAYTYEEVDGGHDMDTADEGLKVFFERCWG